MNKILFILLFFTTQLINSQWTWLNPTPQGNKLKQIIRLNNGNVISAGGCGTILLSTNSGANWIVSHNIHDTTSALTALFRVSDNLIFAGSVESRILRSTDAGLSWQFISRVNNFPGLRRLFFRNANTGYALFDYVVHKTTNGGLNWFQASLLQSCNDIYFPDDNTGYAAGGALVDNVSLTWFYKTVNGGMNWVNMMPPDAGPVSRVQFLNINTGYYAGFGILNKTTNGGANWIFLNLPPGSGMINDFLFFNETTGYAGSYNSYFYTTTNGGVNWSTLHLPYYTFNSHNGITSMSFTDTQHGYAVIHDHMIVRTVNAGVNWTLHTNSINPYTPLRTIEFLDDNNILTGGSGTSNDFIIRKSTDGGSTWNGILPYNYQFASGNIYDMDFPSAATGFAVGGNGSKGYVYKSTNAGNNWIKMDSMGTGSFFNVLFTNVNTGFILGSSGEIFRTSNGGLNWSVFNSGVSNSLNSICFVDANTGYVCGGNAVQKLLRTTNSGLTWNETYSETGNSFRHITFINQTTGFISAKGILKTTDGGNSWMQKIPGPQPFFDRTVFPGTIIGYAYASFGRLFKSTDSGESWGELRMPADYFIADMHFRDNNTGYLVGDQGMILKTTNGGGNFYLGIFSGNNTIPDRHELFQNYPNPFNPVTTIEYSIAVNSFVRIRIYDILGREILTLLNETKPAGYYETVWDASNYPSGVYFYKIVTDGFTESKKMILIK